LARLGFTVISTDRYSPKQGDVIVIQGTKARGHPTNRAATSNEQWLFLLVI
jgi:hypothetical protein